MMVISSYHLLVIDITLFQFMDLLCCTNLDYRSQLIADLLAAGMKSLKD